jgi:hypothetical protein
MKNKTRFFNVLLIAITVFSLSSCGKVPQAKVDATKAAIEEGIVAGGGVALLRTLLALENIQADGDEKTGIMQKENKN